MSWLDTLVLIRDARPDEFDDLGDVRVAAYVTDGFLSPASGYVPRLRSLGADGLDPVLVAVDAGGSGEVLGTVMLQRWPHGGELLRDAGEAEIRALAVRPGARGTGLGQALIDAVIDRARQEGVQHLLLLTQPEMKAAHHLYERAGFVRLPDRDWYPEPDVPLLAYGLPLAGRPHDSRP